MKFSYLLLYIPFLFLMACSSNTNEEENVKVTMKDIVNQPTSTKVKVLTIEPETFNRELFANGKLQALRKANLTFLAPGTIKSVNVIEGMRVPAGRVLAVLDRQQQEREYRQTELRHSQATLDYQDQLLRAGYQLTDTANLDADVKRIARLRSGLSSSEFDLQRIQEEITRRELKAPFAGQVANLKAKPHNQSNSYDYICTLIDDSELEVEFQMLEQELDFVRQSKSIRLQSFSNGESSYSGRITSINPLVDQAGMITVKARVANKDGKLMDGMSVRVIIEQPLSDQLVVPKAAVLDRQNKKVVFTAENGIAKWNYVEIAAENSSEYAIIDGLKPGDEVIYDGNFNLAHDKAVSVVK